MEESIRIRRANEPIELVKWVKSYLLDLDKLLFLIIYIYIFFCLFLYFLLFHVLGLLNRNAIDVGIS